MACDSAVGAVPRTLQVRLVVTAAGGGFALSAFVPPGTVQWVLSLGVWAVAIAHAGYRLDRNRAVGTEAIRSRFGIANGITLFRGWLLACFLGALPSVPVTFAAGLFVAVAALDAVDGAIARRRIETELGARLDAATDAHTVLVGAAAAVSVGALPVWYLLAGGFWYGYTATLAFRRRVGEPVYALPESRLRPLVGSAQFLVVALALFVGATVWTTGGAGLALLALATSFARDWAAATGRLGNPERLLSGHIE